MVSQVGVDIAQIWIGMSAAMGWATWKVKVDRGLGRGWLGRTEVVGEHSRTCDLHPRGTSLQIFDYDPADFLP